jgi:hypothetical protein
MRVRAQAKFDIDVKLSCTCLVHADLEDGVAPRACVVQKMGVHLSVAT